MTGRYKVKLSSDYSKDEFIWILEETFEHKDVLSQLYEAFHRLPPCELLAVIGGAIQEIQYYRNTYDIKPPI